MTLMMETDKSKTKFRHYGHDQGPEDGGVCFVKTTGAMHNITFAICRTFASTYCVHVAEKRFHAKKNRSQAYDKITWAKIIFG